MLGLEQGDIPAKPREGAESAYVSDILKELVELYADTPVKMEQLDAKIMGVFTPKPSEVIRRFSENEKVSSKKATDVFYAMCKANHYIQMDRIEKNLNWTTGTEFGELEITVNISKPEKDPRDIAAARSLPQKSYPKCLLCKENVGFAGNLNHPARQNLRLIPVELESETWHFQYSPYVYYNEHCIVLSPNHVPMKINEAAFRRLIAFVERFPHYFIGSNTDIPIVGGSILTHDHFQGGRHVFPMEKAKSHAFYSHPEFPSIEASLLIWPMSAIRLKSRDKESLLKLCMTILERWTKTDVPEAEIVAFSGDTRHNAITPIARIKDGSYEMDLVLRNNRTSAEHPMGIFHPHQDLHHIKKENIGLIEVMGLAVLPGRLTLDMDEMALAFSGAPFDEKALEPHLDWMGEVKARIGIVPKDEAYDAVKNEIGQVFKRVLQDAGVFKFTSEGKALFHNFMASIGFVRIG
jgi:UDPglucose--hexose-1-phosphate uridylyltransferase